MKFYRILTFDGGGVRSILSAILLKRIAEYIPIIKNANLIGGTSSGSFIALGLANSYLPSEIVSMFSEQNAKEIFANPRINLIRPKYTRNGLEKLLQDYFPNELLLKNLKKKIIVPSFKINNDMPYWHSVFFHNYRNSPYSNTPVIDVALASSAAPTYFSPYKGYVDGGVIANDPSISALSIAIDKNRGNKNINDVVLFSIGTGFLPEKITATNPDWGIIQWSYNPKSQPSIPIIDLLFDGTTDTIRYYSKQLLQDRFYRLNPQLPNTISLDDITKIPQLVDISHKIDLTNVIRWLKKYWL